MNYILFDDNSDNLLPLTFTRPVCEIRIGILTIKEKWEKYLGVSVSHFTAPYLRGKFKFEPAIDDDNVWINGSVCPNEKLVAEINNLKTEECLFAGNVLLALNSGTITDIDFTIDNRFGTLFKKYESHAHATQLVNLWDIFQKNGEQLVADFNLITQGRNSMALSSSNKIMGIDNIFVEEGAIVECAILNATTGPIYIGASAEIMEGSIVRGPFALCEHSTLKLGAKIYGPTTIGPQSKVGGEVNNSVIFGYSNKAHDGFLGNSVIGEWCNIGADSNNSNLKNNYAEVKLWNYLAQKFVNTGLTFCGLIMADHSKCAINTMFNTGTVVGVNANVFGSGFPRNFIADYSWGGASKMSTYKLSEAFEVAEKVMQRRGITLTDDDKEILTHVFNVTENFRK